MRSRLRRCSVAAVLAVILGVAAPPVAADPAVIHTIEGFTTPIAMVLAPDGRSLYVADPGAGVVSVIDTETNARITQITGFSEPVTMAVTPDGSRVLVSNYTGNTVSVINTATYQKSDIPGFIKPRGIAIVPDGTRAYVANVGTNSVAVIDLVTRHKLDNEISGFTHPWSLSITPDARRAYVTNDWSDDISVIDLESQAKVPTEITGFLHPMAVLVSPDGTRTYVANSGGHALSVIDTLTNTKLESDIGGFVWPIGIAVSADGTHVYVADMNAHSMVVIDTASNTKVGQITGLNGAVSVVLTPDGTRAYVANFWGNSVSDVALRPAPPTAVAASPGTEAVTATWDPPVFTGGQPITSYIATASPGGQSCTANAATNCTIEGLVAGGTYTVTVTATNSIGTSAASTPSAPVIPSAKPAVLQRPGSVSHLKAKVRRGKVRVKWVRAVSVDFYRVRISKPGGKTYKAWHRTTQRSFTAKVKHGKKYRLQVVAVNAAGPGAVATIRFKGK